MKTLNKGRRPLYYYYIIILIVIILINWLVLPSISSSSRVQEVSYSTFLEDIEDKKVETVEIESDTISYTVIGDDDYVYETGVLDDPNLVERLQECGAEFTAIQTTTSGWSLFLYYLLTLILPIVIFMWLGNRTFKKMQKKAGGDSMSFGGGGFNFGNNMGSSNAKVYVDAQTGISFDDVAGQDEAKESLMEVVDFLHNPKKYSEIGAQMPKGVLLVGPPGTGKTLLAKAVAGEAGVPFFSISGSEFVEMFVGRGAARVRDLFKQAREKAPCIVIIDEIDTIGKKRDDSGFSGNDEREQTLNQLLAEMDGFDGSNGVIILAATNRPDSLDSALLRPGRFDRRVQVELPDLRGREAILQVHAKDVKMSPAVDFGAIARSTSGASGADLANIINEAAILAVKDGRKEVVQRDLEEAVETVIAGTARKGAVLPTKEKLIVSYHEIGHALVAAKSRNSMPIQKITIIPRTSGALGYTMQVPEDEVNLMTKEELMTRIVTYTGGRAAEQLIFNTITTGASNDIEQATKLARAMVTRYGMSDTFGMTALETVSNQYLGGDASLACSEQTAALIDEEVVQIIKDAYAQAMQILEENKFKLHELAKFLYERETITGEEFMTILEADSHSLENNA